MILLLRNETSTALDISLSDFWALVVLSLVPGLAALMIYYKGLSTTPASSATLAELAFPLTAILIGWLVFDTVPTTTQWVGIAILSATIVVMTRAAAQGREALGVKDVRPAFARRR